MDPLPALIPSLQELVILHKSDQLLMEVLRRGLANEIVNVVS